MVDKSESMAGLAGPGGSNNDCENDRLQGLE